MRNQEVTLKQFLAPERILHAYVIEGKRERGIPTLLEILGEIFLIEVKGNPDVQVLRYDRMGIEEARQLIERAGQKPLKGEHTFFLLECNSITREAQNALLKLFEEPVKSAHFFLFIPIFDMLLPTLRSRLFLLPLVSEKETGRTSQIEMFVKASSPRRLEFLKEIIETKDKVAAINFLNELEVYFHSRLSQSAITSDESKALADLEQVQSYLNDRAPSVKMLLEHIALVTPKF